MSEPRFAVVGHPNKGKSSIVATLAADDQVRVAPTPGTTTRSREFPMSVDGQTLYTLIDTPGFQRARRAWDWMKQRQTSADQHAQVVRDFIAEQERADHYPDEVELLRPLMEPDKPAGILYVVDGSVPYGPEYEAEMEILRWAGRPSLALINPIGQADHVDAWRAALGQYFKIVRVFNAVTAEFDKRLELLRAFGQLQDDWRGPLEQAVRALDADRTRRRRESARELAALLAEALTLTAEKKLGPDADAKPYREELLEKFKGELRRRERRCRDAVEAIYDHHGLDRQESDDEYESLKEDLFSEKTWAEFGLTRRNLAALGAVSGGVAGAMGTHWVDVVTGGATLGGATAAGGVLGAATGGVLGWMGGGKIAEFKVINRTLGGKLLQCGPVRNPNFPFVLFGRARLHHALVAGRTHAQRGTLEVAAASVPALDETQRAVLAKGFKAAAKAGNDREALGEAQVGLTEVIESILTGDEKRGQAQD
ncbi:MAG: GTPase/DUF3482 domain-containing protein [Planctomycetota bacterium]